MRAWLWKENKLSILYGSITTSNVELSQLYQHLGKSHERHLTSYIHAVYALNFHSTIFTVSLHHDYIMVTSSFLQNRCGIHYNRPTTNRSMQAGQALTLPKDTNAGAVLENKIGGGTRENYAGRACVPGEISLINIHEMPIFCIFAPRLRLK